MFSEILQGSDSPGAVPLESKRLKDTVQTIAHRWVPCHPMLRKRFQSMCLRTNPDRKDVLALLMQDPGLCIFVLRSIRRSFPGKDTICIRTALNEIELEKLANEVSRPEYEISSTSYKSASRHQTFELQQSVFMTGAAEFIAEKASLDSMTAMWEAFRKELGYLLLSFSYPQLFNRAMSRSKRAGSPLADELKRLLGVTPAEVSSYLLSQWRLTLDEVETESKDDITIDDVVASSEVWARSQDPVYGERAREQWDKIAPVMTDVFGGEFEDELAERCAEKFLPHTALLPLASGVSGREEIEPEPFDITATHSEMAAERIKSSRTLNRLPDYMQDVFADIIEKSDNVITAQEGLRELVNRLVPLLGFERGCLFTLSKDGDRMFPVLRFGDLPLERYDERLFDKYQGMKPLIFHSVPFKREGIGFAGEFVTYLCGGMDSGKYQGVLYLEKPLTTEETLVEDEASLLYFRCLRETLNSLFETLLSGPS